MYETGPTRESYAFTFATPEDSTLLELKTRYGLEALVAGSESDLERVRRICEWVHGLWEHDGDNEPSAPDALTILEEAVAGKNFRCVEYSVVLASCTAALGLPSRVVQVKTEDSETREFGAGHVVTEVFLRDIQCWVMVDGQWNMIPRYEGKPLNALELRLTLDEGIIITSATELPVEQLHDYSAWIDEYLFYFTTLLDNRDVTAWDGAKLVLRPLGAKEPEVFQRRFPIIDTIYTHAARAFYPEP